MPADQPAIAQFRKMMKWILIAAVIMVAGALAFLASQGTLTTHMVVATIAGTFFSVLLGCGLFALAFFVLRPLMILVLPALSVVSSYLVVLQWL